MANVSFKLDPASLPKLAPRGDNYSEWRPSWTLAFRYAKLWDVVSGKKTRTEENQEQWEEDDTKALVMLLSAVHTDLTLTVTGYDTSAKAWAALAERFDRDTGNSTIYLFRNITTLRYKDGDDLQKHLDEFHGLWQKMQKRCQSSNQEVAKAMRPVFDSDQVKGSFFLATLPDTMDNIIDNLNTKEISKFVDIEPKMLDIAEKHLHAAEPQAAYYTSTARTHPKGKQNIQGKEQVECTWCRKHNLTFVGHVYTNCEHLKQHQANKKAGQPSSTTPRPSSTTSQPSRRAHKARTADAEEEDEEDDDVVAFSTLASNPIIAHTQPILPPQQPILSHTRKRSLEDENHDIDALAVKLHPLSLQSQSRSWIFDTGATRHMSGYAEDFMTLAPQKGTITIAGGHKLPIEGMGTVCLRVLLPSGATKDTKLTNVIYSRFLKGTRLFSWPHICQMGYTMTGKGNDVFVNSEDGECVLWARRRHSTLEIQTDEAAAANFASYDEFHHAIGHSHINHATAVRLYEDGHLVPKQPQNYHCEPCSLAKSVHHRPKPLQQSRSDAAFDLIHSDVSGKFSQKSMGGSRYFITFIDGYSRYCWMYFLKTRDEAITATSDFIQFIKTQFGQTIKAFRSDNGGEYKNDKFKQLFKQHGIFPHPTPPYSHESNGVAERYNRTIVTDARAMIEKDEHLMLWAEAIAMACYLRNRKPHSTLPTKITPCEALLHHKPSIGHLRPFMSPCYVHIPVEVRKPGTKLLDRAEKGFLVGYHTDTILRIYVPQRNTIVHSQDVRFPPWQCDVLKPQPLLTIHEMDEPTSTMRPTSAGTQQIPRPDKLKLETLPPPLANKTNKIPHPTTPKMARSPSRLPIPSPATPTPSPSKSPTKTRAGRIVKPTARAMGQMAQGEVLETDDGQDEIDCVALLAQGTDIPSSFAAAQKSAEWPFWKKAIEHELASHHDNGTWEPAAERDIDPQHIVDSRWVFAKKYNSDGELVKHKARLVARGFTQIHGINYDDTYSPVARYESLRIIIRLAALGNMQLHQMDFDTAYLNSDLSHRVYMRCPQGLLMADPNTILLVLKALYGLKQSGREWFGTLRTTLLKHGLKEASFDPCVFVSENLIIGVYVDDLLIAGHAPEVENFKKMIAKQFKCKDLGMAKYLLGLEITQTDSAITISQHAYAYRVLERFHMESCNARQTPLDPTYLQKTTDDDDLADVKKYQQIMGSINFLVVGTRVDLAFPVAMLSTFNSRPNTTHMAAAHQLLRFLKGTLDMKLTFNRQPSTSHEKSQLKMFSDASFANDPETARSYSGFVLLFAGSPVCWNAKRQSSVAKSTCEAEYVAASHAASQLIWVRNALKELHCDVDTAQTRLLCDNQPALNLIQNHRFSGKSKHMAVHFHFLRERNGIDYIVDHIASGDNVADICTKILARPLLTRYCSMIYKN
ncbi:Retrovirus-related Pol polyprotein from transposon TNT 1-94 [Exophiala dermatitidis]